MSRLASVTTTTLTGRKRARADADGDNDDNIGVAGGEGSRGAKRGRFASGAGECSVEAMAGEMGATASSVEEKAFGARKGKGVQEEKAGDLDGRGEKEKDDDRLVILRLHECGRRERRRSAQAAVKGWMAVNGLHPTSAYKHLKPRRNVRLTEEGEWVWSVEARGKEKVEQTSVVNVEVEVEGYFEAEGKGYVGYVRMDRVPRRTVVEEVEGGGEDAEDRRYLGWVVLGLRQLEEKKRARRREREREREKQALRKGEGKADVRKRVQEHESEGVVYLVVVPRGKVSAIRLYTGSVSRRVLEEGKGNRTGLLRQALTPRDPNPRPGPREEDGLCGVTLSYEQIDLKEPYDGAAALFRGFFLRHGLLASGNPQ